jgi:hypothetical protein
MGPVGGPHRALPEVEQSACQRLPHRSKYMFLNDFQPNMGRHFFYRQANFYIFTARLL